MGMGYELKCDSTWGWVMNLNVTVHGDGLWFRNEEQKSQVTWFSKSPLQHYCSCTCVMRTLLIQDGARKHLIS